VWVTHLDAGLVEPGQAAKLKLTAYPFQQYGMLNARAPRGRIVVASIESEPWGR
jgi:hypothetical protein